MERKYANWQLYFFILDHDSLPFERDHDLSNGIKSYSQQKGNTLPPSSSTEEDKILDNPQGQGSIKLDHNSLNEVKTDAQLGSRSFLDSLFSEREHNLANQKESHSQQKGRILDDNSLLSLRDQDLSNEIEGSSQQKRHYYLLEAKKTENQIYYKLVSMMKYIWLAIILRFIIQQNLIRRFSDLYQIFIHIFLNLLQFQDFPEYSIGGNRIQKFFENL